MDLIPEITLTRVKLRPQRYGDWPAYQAFMASPGTRYMGGPLDAAQAWGFFCHDLAQWQLFGHGALMIECRKTGACLGQICINHGPLFPEKELGWYLYPEAEGFGYAFEAALGLRNWAFETLKLPSLVSYIDPENQRSKQLALRLGAVLDDQAPRPEPADLVFRHTP